MKFIMIVLTIRFLAGLISNKRKWMKAGRMNEINEINKTIRHPAEYELR